MSNQRSNRRFDVEKKLEQILDEGIWEWNDDGQWKAFDEEASNQIEEALQKAITDIGNKKLRKCEFISDFITKGPFFGKDANVALYRYAIDLHYETPFPYLIKAKQVNIKTNITRDIRRMPPLIKPVQTKLVADMLRKRNRVKWQWLDDNDVWKPFDPETCEQIEKAFQKGYKKCDLTYGYFTGKANMYSVEFDRISYGLNGYQVNKHTRFRRNIRRKSNEDEGQDLKTIQANWFKNKYDEHFKWRRVYEPLSKSEFKEGMKCSASGQTLKKSDLFEETKFDDFKVEWTNNDNSHKMRTPRKMICNSKGYKKRLRNNHIIWLKYCGCVYYMKNATKKLTDYQNSMTRGCCVVKGCQYRYELLPGKQPNGTLKIFLNKSKNCEGFESVGTIFLTFSFLRKQNVNDINADPNVQYPNLQGISSFHSIYVRIYYNILHDNE